MRQHYSAYQPLHLSLTPQKTLGKFSKDLVIPEQLSPELFQEYLSWCRLEVLSWLYQRIGSTRELPLEAIQTLYEILIKLANNHPLKSVEERYPIWSLFWKKLIEQLVKQFRGVELQLLIDTLINEKREEDLLLECKCALLERLLTFYIEQPLIFEWETGFEKQLRISLWQKNYEEILSLVDSEHSFFNSLTRQIYAIAEICLISPSISDEELVHSLSQCDSLKGYEPKSQLLLYLVSCLRAPNTLSSEQLSDLFASYPDLSIVFLYLLLNGNCSIPSSTPLPAPLYIAWLGYKLTLISDA